MNFGCFLQLSETPILLKPRIKWKRHDIWTSYFYGFWKALRQKYEKDGMWEKRERFNLLYIVTLMALQDLFLIKKAQGDAQFESLEDFVEQVERFFEKVPGTFFKGWEATGSRAGKDPIISKEPLWTCVTAGSWERLLRTALSFVSPRLCLLSMTLTNSFHTILQTISGTGNKPDRHALTLLLGSVSQQLSDDFSANCRYIEETRVRAEAHLSLVMAMRALWSITQSDCSPPPNPITNALPADR